MADFMEALANFHAAKHGICTAEVMALRDALDDYILEHVGEAECEGLNCEAEAFIPYRSTWTCADCRVSQ